MATSSHLLLIGACVVMLALRHLSQACSKDQIPAGCQCIGESVIQCTGLDKFPNITNIKRFFFINCKFTNVGGENIPKYDEAEVISLSNCRIERIAPNAFHSAIITLRELEIDGNFITNITKEVLNLPHLTNLIMERNSLTELPSDVFSRLIDVKQINLANNDISSLPDNIFKENTNLVKIDIDFAKLTEIPKAITSVPNLRYLVFAGNTVGPLTPEMFKDLSSLEYLDMGTCGATSIDAQAFSGLEKISTLRLSSNELREIPRDLFSPMRGTLRDLWLDHNLLTSLENGTIPVGNLSEVHLGFNPWHCDKKIAWLKDLHLEKIDHENVTCMTPPSLAGLTLANVTRAMLVNTPASNGNRSMIVAAIAIPIIVICVLLIFCIILRMVQNRKQQKRAQVRYSAVYRDTVESSRPGHHHQYRPTSEI